MPLVATPFISPFIYNEFHMSNENFRINKFRICPGIRKIFTTKINQSTVLQEPEAEPRTSVNN